jgi:hypothetical protein
MNREVIDVLSPGLSADPYSGEQVQDWDDPTTRTVTCLAPAEPRPSGEPQQDARNSVTSGWTLYLPSGDPITVHDRVVVRGQTYPVQGTPSDWGVAGVVVQAYRTEG